MAIQIGAKLDSGFDDPIGMLKDCHRRIERFLGVLRRVAEIAQGRSLTEEEKTALKTAVRYFEESGPRHTADEEESLFPRLREVAPADSVSEIERLERDHICANQLHEQVALLSSTWISIGVLKPEEQQLLLSSTAALQQLYVEHILLEEQVVFPLAAKSFDSKTLAAIGAEFTMRRA